MRRVGVARRLDFTIDNLKEIALKEMTFRLNKPSTDELLVRTVDVPYFYVPRVPDPTESSGSFCWPDWRSAKPIELLKIRHEPEDTLPLRERTLVSAMWDQQNLYLAFAVFDREVWATIREFDARLFHEECVEFLIDPDGDGRRYAETQVNSLGTIRDLLVDGTIRRPTVAQYDAMAEWHFRALRTEISEFNDEDAHLAGWKLQLAVPWHEFDFSRRTWPPQTGEELRINFYRYERPQSGMGSLELSGWSRVDGSFHQPGRFGRLIFQSCGCHISMDDAGGSNNSIAVSQWRTVWR